MTWPATRLLAGLLAMLALVLALEWLLPGAAVPAVTPVLRRHGAGPAAALPTRDTGGWVSAVLARPVFSISRRPPRPVAAGRGAPDVGQARLAGIMITRSGRRAIFAPAGGGHALVLAERASVNQGSIRSIFPDRVVMADGTVLRPSYDRNRPGQTTAPFFQPNQQGFANPAFPGAPAPGFPPINFPPPNMARPQQELGDDGLPLPFQPPQAFRGPAVPPRREQ